MRYQLVLQFPASSIEDYDAMIELEEAIAGRLRDLGDVDGHDAGSGEMNIFILTDQPKAAFERIMCLDGTAEFLPTMKAAFRVIGKDEFTILRPAGLAHFAVV